MKILTVTALWLAVLAAWSPPARATDYLVTASHPNRLHLIDVKARAVVRSMDIPGDGAPETISTTRTGKVAYVLTNHLGSVAGMDLETGEQVFRADFSHDDIRAKSISAMTVGGDGRELFVFLSPVHLMPAEYKVLDTEIAVYDTAAGTAAKPVRSFPAPRGIMQLLSSPDGKTLYAFGFNVYTIDAASGKILSTFKIRNWDRPEFAMPDVLTMWTAPETSGIYATGYGAMRRDMDPANPLASYAGLMLLDMASGEITLREYERGGPITFSAVVNPLRHDEIYTVYLYLSKLDLSRDIDLDARPTDSLVVKRFGLPHTYYNINISSDGEEIYLGGTMSDIAIYGTAEMEPRGNIQLPGGGDMALTFVKMLSWPDPD